MHPHPEDDSIKRDVLQRRNLNTLAAAVEPAHVMPHQRNMLHAFDDDDNIDWYRLLAAIHDAEDDIAPERNASRIFSRDTWNQQVLPLLLQLEPDVLRAIIDNTFPQRWQRDMWGVLRDPADVTEGYDPVIYVNYLADKFGKGVDVGDVEEFHRALMVAVGLEGSQAEQDHLRKSMDDTWQKMPTISKKSKAKPFTALLDNKSSLAETVERYVDAQAEVISVASQQNVSHIAIHGEVGWSSEGYKRCKTHQDLDPQSSLPILMLVHVVLRTLFPK